MSADDERVAAVRRRLSDLATDWDRWAPVLLGDFAEIGRRAGEFPAGAVAEITDVTAEVKPAAPAKPAPRRRTRT